VPCLLFYGLWELGEVLGFGGCPEKRGAIELANLVVECMREWEKCRREKPTRLDSRRHDAKQIAVAGKDQGSSIKPRNKGLRHA